MHYQFREVKHQRSRFANPSPEEIPDLWAGYLATESLAPSGLRAGIARARTALLNAVPTYRLPETLDRLADYIGATAYLKAPRQTGDGHEAV